MPYLGVFLGLLVLMMCSTSTPTHGVGVNLPKAQNATTQRFAVREDAIRITVAASGRVFFRNRESAPEKLPELIREAVGHGAERKIYLLADARTRYSDVELVVNQIQLAGIRDVVIIADKPKTP